MKRIDWNRYTPPGREKSDFAAMFWLWLSGGVLWSLRFIGNYIGAWNQLYEYRGMIAQSGNRVLISGRVIAPFREILEDSMNLFPVCFLFLALDVMASYYYFKKDTMSIYLMRRLPDRWELHRRCWGKPLILSGLCLLIQAGLIALYFLIYLVFTPRGHLPF